MKKKIFATAIIVMTIVTIIYFSLQSVDNNVSDKPVIKIGFIAPMTGDNAMLGEKCLQGLELALDKIQDEIFRYKLIVEDDSWQMRRAVTAANKLINLDKVDFLYLCSAPTANAVVNLADNNKMFMITINSSDTTFAKASPYSFLHWVSSQKEGEQAVKIFKKYGAKKVLFLVTVHPGAEALYEGISEGAREVGIEVAKMSIMPRDLDYTTIVQKASAYEADMWHILVLDPGLTLLYKRMLEQGINIPYASSELPNFTETREMWEGNYFTDAYDGAPEVIAAYREKHKTNNIYSIAYAYDSMIIIDKLYREFFAQNDRLATGTELSFALQNMKDYTGAVGPITVNLDGVLQSEAVIKTFKNGEALVVELE